MSQPIWPIGIPPLARGLNPRGAPANRVPKKIFLFAGFCACNGRSYLYTGSITPGDDRMSIEEINQTLTLASLEMAGIVEPCDDDGCHPLEWAEIVGVDIFDEVYGEVA